MMPADLKQRSLTLSVDDVVMEEKEEGEGDGEGEMEYLHAAEGEGCV